MGGRVGYEYRYRFWMEDEEKLKEDEIIKLYKLKLNLGGDGMKRFVFEIRTNFVVKKKRADEDEGGFEEEILDSERFVTCVSDRFGFIGLESDVGVRLWEYWMTRNEILTMTLVAFDFARQMAADVQYATLGVIPIVVGLEVCTVQQEGEPVESTMGRAIRAENLIPLSLCLFEMQEQPEEKQEEPMQHSLLALFEKRLWALFEKPEEAMHSLLRLYLIRLPRIRVEDIEQGLGLMQSCPICSRPPTIAAQVTYLPCRHAFHSHCLVRYLETNMLCPVCNSQARSYSYLMQCLSHGRHSHSP